MNLVTIIAMLIIIITIIYLTTFRSAKTATSKKDNDGCNGSTLNIIREQQSCAPYDCQGKCVEGVDGGLSCDGTYSCNQATIRPFSGSDNVVCIGHDSCNKASIYGNAICNGQQSCKSAVITGNACCTSDEACLDANIGGTKTINNECYNNGERITGLTWHQNWWDQSCNEKNIFIESELDQEDQAMKHGYKCAKGPLQCTGEYACYGLIIDGKASCKSEGACFDAIINGIAICQGLESCLGASISGDAVCHGENACAEAYIHGNACCTSIEACPESTKVIGTKTTDAGCA